MSRQAWSSAASRAVARAARFDGLRVGGFGGAVDVDDIRAGWYVGCLVRRALCARFFRSRSQRVPVS